MTTPITRVVKIGGRAQGAADLPATIAAAVAAGERLVIVHGGGDEVSSLQRRLGLEPRFVDGRRATTVEDLGVVQMVLSGTVNKRLVSRLSSAGVRAVGISGEDGLLLQAAAVDREALGEVGAPSRVEAALLDTLLDGGFVPVISPLARDEATGAPLNVNGDDAAAALAAALGADELLLVADVPGVLEDGVVIPALDADGMRALVAGGAASGGMIAKLDAARRALDHGVPRVRIADLAAIADPARGTLLMLSSPAVPRS
jgi:acetylglutamate kinase